jgi:YD repeat-containing protein
VSAARQPVLRSTYQYDYQNRLRELKHFGTAAQTDPLTSYTFQFDAAGRLTSIDYADGLAEYSYDGTGQLTGALYPSQANETYTYSPTGNRTMPGYLIGDHNRIVADGSYTYLYDAEGNRIRRTNVATGA